jgi:hypothetical protein
MGCRYSNNLHARGASGLNTNVRIFEYHALRRMSG